MSGGHLLVLLLSTQVCSNFAFECDFQYTEVLPAKDGESNQLMGQNRLRRDSEQNIPKVIISAPLRPGEFECVDRTIAHVDSSVMLRGGWDDEDDDEVPSDCETVEEEIKPNYMKNIRGKNITVYRTASFVQKISTKKCRSHANNLTASSETCNFGLVAPKNQRNICKTILFKVNLKALNGSNGTTYEDTFYYPSNCVCGLYSAKSSP